MGHIICGGIAIVLGIFGIIGWWDNFGDFLRGAIPLFLLISGLIAVACGLGHSARVIGKKDSVVDK